MRRNNSSRQFGFTCVIISMIESLQWKILIWIDENSEMNEALNHLKTNQFTVQCNNLLH